MVQFQLLDPSEAIPWGYRLATRQDVENNKQDMLQAMPGITIANLANGSVDGASFGGRVRRDIRENVPHKLVVCDPSLSQPSTFQIFNVNDPLPQGYRLATYEEVYKANVEELRAAMPGWEIANLADGSIAGASEGFEMGSKTRDDAGRKLATHRVTRPGDSLLD